MKKPRKLWRCRRMTSFKFHTNMYNKLDLKLRWTQKALRVSNDSRIEMLLNGERAPKTFLKHLPIEELAYQNKFKCSNLFWTFVRQRNFSKIVIFRLLFHQNEYFLWAWTSNADKRRASVETSKIGNLIIVRVKSFRCKEGVLCYQKMLAILSY